MALNGYAALPFRKKDGAKESVYTSLDCINIEKQLGLTYGPGSLEERKALAAAAAAPPGASTKTIKVSGINRAAIRGSFVVAAYANIGGKRVLVGTESVLSRWSVQGCANCQTHLDVRAFIGLHRFQEAALKSADFEVQIRTRDGLLDRPRAALAALAMFEKKPFRVEVR